MAVSFEKEKGKWKKNEEKLGRKCHHFGRRGFRFFWTRNR